MQSRPNWGSLYHYTTLEGLKGIVENKSLRLTDYRFLNDPQEIQYCMEKAEEVLSQYDEKNEIIVELKRIILNIKKGLFDYVQMGKDAQGNIESVRMPNIKGFLYILSLTMCADDLALWSMYGRNGYRIKFDNFKLMINILMSCLGMDLETNKNIPNFNFGHVSYRNDSNTLKGFLDFIIENKTIDDPNNIINFFALQKDPIYSYEKEYRVCLCLPNRMIGNNTKKVFMPKNNILKPQLEIMNLPIEDLIEEVMISPYNNSDCAKASIEEFLEFSLGKKIPVVNSKIKVREL